MPINLGELNEQQQQAVCHLNGPLLIMAGAGSGKTKVLTYRIAHILDQGVAPYRVLAITFTNKAAREMQHRVSTLVDESTAKNIWLHTFHAFCARFLRYEIDNIPSYNKNFAIYDSSDSQNIIKACLKELNLDEKKFTIYSIASAISNAKNNLQDASRFKALAKGFMDEKIADIYTLYEKKLISNNAMDFDDLLLVTVRALANDAQLLAKYQQKFSYILIDEYQDTNKSQYLLAQMLSEKHRNICVVGDADQSIYAWRGADMRNILDFERDYPDCRIIKLEKNYRSTKTILEAANAVISNNNMRPDKNLWTDNAQGEKIYHYTAGDEHDEARFITQNIKDLNQKGVNYRDMAILYRTNAQSRLLEEHMMKNSLPYVMVGGQKFYERREIKDIVAYLRVIFNSQDDLSLSRIINVPRRGIGDTTVAKVREFANTEDISLFTALERSGEFLPTRFALKLEQFANTIRDLREFHQTHNCVASLIDAILFKTGYLTQLKEEKSEQVHDRVDNIYELTSLAKSLSEEKNVEPVEEPLEAFLLHISLVTDLESSDSSGSSVTLMTLHSAKGLEFDIVFLTGLEEGVFPHSRTFANPIEIEEERRLCYVGITRAKKRLYISNSRSRMIHGNYVAYAPSRFIDEIPMDLIERQIRPQVAKSAIQPIIKPSAHSTVPSGFSFKRSTTNTTAKSAISTVVFTPGDKVQHKVWGQGQITSVRPSANYQELTISFPSVGEKTIVSNGGYVTKI